MGIYHEVEVRPLAVGDHWQNDEAVLMPDGPPRGMRWVLFQCYACGAFAILLLIVGLVQAGRWLWSMRNRPKPTPTKRRAFERRGSELL